MLIFWSRTTCIQSMHNLTKIRCLMIYIYIYIYICFSLAMQTNIYNKHLFFISLVFIIQTPVGPYAKYKPRSDQTKGYNIGICCFSAEHAALRSKSLDWLTRNHVYTRTVVSVRQHYKDPPLRVLVQYKTNIISISLKSNLISPSYS